MGKNFFVGVLLIYGELVASCGGKGKQWDRLLVNFRTRKALPCTEDQALKKGWMNDAKCGSNNPFYGNRYVLGSDISTRVLFDNDGALVGIQGTITESDGLIPSPIRPRPGAFVKDDHGNYLLTAYFIKKPQEICKKKGGRRHYHGKGKECTKPKDALVLQMSDVRLCKPRFMDIPMDENELAQTKWVKGKCFPGMGVHYWYDTSVEMHCDQFFPMFLLYNQESRRLKSFGWSTASNITSPLWEHPTDRVFPLFFEEVPRCLFQQEVLSTQHIYLTDPNKLICNTAVAGDDEPSAAVE